MGVEDRVPELRLEDEADGNARHSPVLRPHAAGEQWLDVQAANC